MKIILALAALLASVPCFAHLELGTYRGVTNNGLGCEFEVQSITFQNDIHHPLNERVQIQYGDKTFTLQHLPQVDLDSMNIGVDRDRLTGVIGSPQVTMALVLAMDHSPGKDGPVALTAVANDKTGPGVKAKRVCTDLIHVSY